MRLQEVESLLCKPEAEFKSRISTPHLTEKKKSHSDEKKLSALLQVLTAPLSLLKTEPLP
jgi:hypothetical protein